MTNATIKVRDLKGNVLTTTANVGDIYCMGGIDKIESCFKTKQNDDNINEYVVEVEIKDFDYIFSTKAFSFFDFTSFSLGITDYVERKNYEAKMSLTELAIELSK